MKINVKLFASLRKGRFKQKNMEFPEGTTVQEILAQLSISRQEMEIGIIFVNGKRAVFTSVLAEGDNLAIFPPAAGG